MIKLIIFDLDGVLVSTKGLHHKAFNMALPFDISEEEHKKLYEGLTTRQKLNKLCELGLIKEEDKEDIWLSKQLFTEDFIVDFSPDPVQERMVEELSEKYKLAVCTNATRKTSYKILDGLFEYEHFNFRFTGDDVENVKPHPEMFWEAMSAAKVYPHETLIIEDSDTGVAAARHSGAHIMRVESPEDVSLARIKYKIERLKFPEDMEWIFGYDVPYVKWNAPNMNVIIPMAGLGSRFKDSKRYGKPKPLIDVDGIPMIEAVIRNLELNANYIFIIQKKDDELWNVSSKLRSIVTRCEIVVIDGLTDGAATTVLQARHLINNSDPLLIVNSDQIVEWDVVDFMQDISESQVDGAILTHKATDPKWSFAEVGEDGYVKRVAEKDPISDDATVGIYYWKKASDFIAAATEMIFQRDTVNGEYYVAPVYNEAIKRGAKITTYEVDKMWGLGTPEDLDHYLKYK